MEKYFEDARQDEKHVPELLKSRLRPKPCVKEGLRPIAFKMIQFAPKNKKTRFQLFGFRKSKVFLPETNASLLAGRFSTTFDPARGQIFKEVRVLARRALTLVLTA